MEFSNEEKLLSKVDKNCRDTVLLVFLEYFRPKTGQDEVCIRLLAGEN